MDDDDKEPDDKPPEPAPDAAQEGGAKLREVSEDELEQILAAHETWLPSWFVELGNGDKFFFDVGIGSQSNFAMLQVPFKEADKVFLSHLHVDHAGDLDTLWISGWVGGRYDRPLRVWGPSGVTPALGTRNFLEMLRNAWAWDITSRHGRLPARWY